MATISPSIAVVVRADDLLTADAGRVGRRPMRGEAGAPVREARCLRLVIGVGERVGPDYVAALRLHRDRGRRGVGARERALQVQLTSRTGTAGWLSPRRPCSGRRIDWYQSTSSRRPSPSATLDS